MKITSIKLTKVNKDYGHVVAMASIVIDNAICIHDIKVVSTNDRMFISMPSRRGYKGTYRDIVHPINTKTREELEAIILDEYKKLEGNDNG